MLKMKHPTFPITLPISGKKISIRPFTVKEEKILLMALEEKSADAILEATKSIVESCVQTEGFDINDLMMVDLEWLFLQVRSKSVSNIVEVSIKDEDDEKVYDFEVDIADIKVVHNPDHTKKIFLTENSGVVMRYPTLNQIVEMNSYGVDNVVDIMFYLYAICLEKVFDGEKVEVIGDFSIEEAKEFMENMSKASFQKIEKFFETAPSIQYTIKYKNSQDKVKEIVLKGLDDFFT